MTVQLQHTAQSIIFNTAAREQHLLTLVIASQNYLALKSAQMSISSEACLEILSGIRNTVKSRGMKPVAVCIMDPSGLEIASLRLDGVPPAAFPNFAKAKAKACVSLGCSSREFKERYEATKLSQLLFMSESQGLAPFPGGVLVKHSATGDILGSVGVSGASSDEDEFLALTGIRSSSALVDVVTEPTEHKLEIS